MKIDLEEKTPTPMPDELGKLREELRWQGRCLSALTVSSLGVMLYLLRPVLIPFVLAIFFTVGLKPLLNVLQTRLHLNRVAAVIAAFLLVVIMLLMLSGAVATSISELANDTEYQERAAAASERIAAIADRIGLLPEDSGDDPEVKNSRVARLQEVVHQGAEVGKQWLLGGMTTLSSSLGIVLIYMFFLLLGASDTGGRSSQLWDIIHEKLREYIVLKTVISLGTGIAVWIVLAIFNIPLALLMGLLTFLLNYIPNFGPLVTCVLPLPLIWLNPDLGVVSMTLASVAVCGVQIVGGNVIEPRMMGSSFELHPIVVLLALMVWYSIWGFVGMLLAIPMTSAIKVILQRIDRTEAIARLMEGDLTALRIGDESTTSN